MGLDETMAAKRRSAESGIAGKRKAGRDGEQGKEGSKGKRDPKPPAPLLFAQVKNGNRNYMAMIDTGAQVNVIGPDLIGHLQKESLNSIPMGLEGCGGESKASDWYSVPLEFGNGLRVEIDAVVSAEFGTALILGSQFLHEYDIGIEYSPPHLRTSRGNVPCLKGLRLKKSNYQVMIGAVVQPAMQEEDERVLEKIVANARITAEEKERLRQLLIEYGDLWIGDPRGRTHLTQHSIELMSDKPIRERPRRFTPEQLKVIDEEVAKMLKDKVIQPSKSSYAQEPHLILKKTGDWRFCVDFRRLNAVTKTDEWPMPKIQDLIRSVRNSAYFVGLDLRSGYWQIPLSPEAVPLTAFRTRSGLYEFLVLPFGLKTAPATFTRCMDKLVGDMFWDGVCVYLDDVLIHGETFDETFTKLREVLRRLREANLTLSMNKCTFFPEFLLYLGFIIKEGRLTPNPEKVEVLKKIKAPTCVRDVRSLLGCVGYFRQFIPNYASIAAPLNRLLRKGVPFEWGKECEEAKSKLLELLVEATLANPLEGDLMKVETDASAEAIGAALYCKASEEEQWRPVEFISKSLTPTERKWPAHEREAYAIVYSLQKFEPFLKGREFQVFTDNRSLQWMTTAKSGKVARWASILAEYRMTIIFRPGNTNVCADFLSRFVDHSPDALVPERAFVNFIGTQPPDIDEIIAAQQAQFPPRGPGYYSRDGVVYFGSRVWVPPAQRIPLIERFHNAATYYHPGVKKLVAAIRKLFSWSGITADVTRYNKSCLGCQRIRPGTEALQGRLTSHPVEGPGCRVYMDNYIVKVDGREVAILSMIDQHTKWVEARVLKDRSAASVASVFVQEWVSRFGCPTTLIVDNEKGFISELMREVCQLLGVLRLPTTVDHPDANAPIETFHRTLTRGFQRYLVTEKRRIAVEELLQLILLGYRSSYHSSTRETPAYLTLGFDPRMGSGSLGNRCLPENQQRIDILNAVREEVMHRAFIRGVQQYAGTQQYRRTDPLKVGEVVLLPLERGEVGCRLSHRGGLKIQPKFTMPYRVVHVFNMGRSAICRNLCVVSRFCSAYREASIQDLRRVELPFTEQQLAEWNTVLKNYYSEYVETEETQEFLIKLFWKEVENPPLEVDRGKRRRHDSQGALNEPFAPNQSPPF